MIRCVVVLLVCLSFATGQEDLRGLRDNRIIGAAKIEKLKARIEEDKKKLEQFETDFDNSDGTVKPASARSGVTENSDVQEEGDPLDDIPPEDSFHFEINVRPGRPCLEGKFDQILLALMRVGFMDLDVWFDEVEDISQDETGQNRMLSAGQFKFAGAGCRRCRGKKKKRSGGRRYLSEEMEPFRHRDLQTQLGGDPLESDNIAARMEEALAVALVDTFGENPDNCLSEATVDDFDLYFFFDEQ